MSIQCLNYNLKIFDEYVVQIIQKMSMYSNFQPKNRQLAERLSKKLQASFSDLTSKEEPAERGLDLKIDELSQKYLTFKRKNERNVLQIENDLQIVQSIVESLERSKNKTADSHLQIYQMFQKQVQGQQLENTQKMGAVRKGMIEDIDKKKKAMKADAIEIIQSQFEQMCKMNLLDIQKRMGNVINILQEQRQAKEESAAEIAQNIGQQILKMQQIMAQQREQRKAQNQKLLDLILEVQQKIEMELREQVKNRQKNEQNIQRRLEQVCLKIQSKVLGSA